MIWGSRGSKVGSLNSGWGASWPDERWKIARQLWREAHFQVKMYKTHHGRTTFGSWDVEKVHAVVARSTSRSQNVQITPFSDHFWKLRCGKKCTPCGAKHIPSQNVQNTSVSDDFWKLRCRKSARRCGAKHIWKSKCTKHTRCGPLLAVGDVEKVHAVVARSTFGSQHVKNTRSSGPLLEVQISKKCTPLWREAHLEAKMLKTLGVRTTFGGSDVEKVHAVVARSAFGNQNVKNTRGSDHFWRLMSLRFTTLHYTKLHYATLDYITLHYTEWHCTTDRQVDR